jgi:hypothetical protein
MNVEEVLLVAKRRMHAPQSEASEASDDWWLVVQAKSGCSTAFWQLYRRHRVKVCHTILRVVRQREDAEDAFNDVFSEPSQI